MKKMLCLVISLIVLLGSVSALAEGFSIHSGVEFGMTMEEVIQKEKDAGFSDVEIYEIDDFEIKYCSDEHSPKGVQVYGQIAGADGANIVYHFQENGGMDAAIYTLNASSTNKDRYAAVRESLTKKYGKPDSLMSDVWHTYLDMDVYSYADSCYEKYNNPSIGMSCEIEYSYNDSWLVPQDDGSYIIISGCDYDMDVTRAGTFHITLIGYQHFTEEAINTALAKAKETVDKYNSQLENDL